MFVYFDAENDVMLSLTFTRQVVKKVQLIRATNGEFVWKGLK